MEIRDSEIDFIDLTTYDYIKEPDINTEKKKDLKRKFSKEINEDSKKMKEDQIYIQKSSLQTQKLGSKIIKKIEKNMKKEKRISKKILDQCEEESWSALRKLHPPIGRFHFTNETFCWIRYPENESVPWSLVSSVGVDIGTKNFGIFAKREDRKCFLFAQINLSFSPYPMKIHDIDIKRIKEQDEEEIFDKIHGIDKKHDGMQNASKIVDVIMNHPLLKNLLICKYWCCENQLGKTSSANQPGILKIYEC